MNRGQRVKHEDFGFGTIRYIMFEGTFRERYLVEFDVSNSKLHDGYGLTKDNRCYCCEKKELVSIDGRE